MLKGILYAVTMEQGSAGRPFTEEPEVPFHSRQALCLVSVSMIHVGCDGEVFGWNGS